MGIFLPRLWVRRLVVTFFASALLVVLTTTLACEVACAAAAVRTHFSGGQLVNSSSQGLNGSGTHQNDPQDLMNHGGPCQITLQVPAPVGVSWLAIEALSNWNAPTYVQFDSIVWPPPEPRPRV